MAKEDLSKKYGVKPISADQGGAPILLKQRSYDKDLKKIESGLKRPRPMFYCVATPPKGIAKFWVFHYTPPAFEDSESTDYQNMKAKYLERPAKQFSCGGDRTLKMSLLLNEFGRHENDEVPIGDVEKSISWLRTMKSPIVWDGSVRKPPILLFVWGSMSPLTVVIKDMSVKRTMFDPQTKLAVRATVDLTLIEVTRSIGLAPIEKKQTSGVAEFPEGMGDGE